MEHTRTMILLKKAVDHIESFEDDEAKVVFESLGFTQNELMEIRNSNDYETRETLWVCEHCLMAIESREGNQARLAHSVDETDAVDSKCDWCKEAGFSELYELI